MNNILKNIKKSIIKKENKKKLKLQKCLINVKKKEININQKKYNIVKILTIKNTVNQITKLVNLNNAYQISEFKKINLEKNSMNQRNLMIMQ